METRSGGSLSTNIPSDLIIAPKLALPLLQKWGPAEKWDQAMQAVWWSSNLTAHVPWKSTHLYSQEAW